MGYLFWEGDRWKASTHARKGFDADEYAAISAFLRRLPHKHEFDRRFKQLVEARDEDRDAAFARLLNDPDGQKGKRA